MYRKGLKQGYRLCAQLVGIIRKDKVGADLHKDIDYAHRKVSAVYDRIGIKYAHDKFNAVPLQFTIGYQICA